MGTGTVKTQLPWEMVWEVRHSKSELNILLRIIALANKTGELDSGDKAAANWLAQRYLSILETYEEARRSFNAITKK